MNQQTLIYHMLRDVKRISPFCERFLGTGSVALFEKGKFGIIF